MLSTGDVRGSALIYQSYSDSGMTTEEFYALFGERSKKQCEDENRAPKHQAKTVRKLNKSNSIHGVRNASGISLRNKCKCKALIDNNHNVSQIGFRVEDVSKVCVECDKVAYIHYKKTQRRNCISECTTTSEELNLPQNGLTIVRQNGKKLARGPPLSPGWKRFVKFISSDVKRRRRPRSRRYVSF